LSDKLLISLCVIVRDQQQLLQDMLLHHKGLYDEAVVVITDAAPDPNLYPADPRIRMVHQPWQDDFSLARNRGLEMARGEQILVLDCDERFAPADHGRIRQIARQGGRHCHYFPQLNYFPGRRGRGWHKVQAEHEPYALGAKGYQTVWTGRLYPRDPLIRYQGAVHETMEAGARKAGVEPLQHDINLHHQGHMLAYPRSEGRTEFYGRLLQEKIRLQPEDPCTRYEMAVHLTGIGREDLARKLLENTLRRVGDWPTRYRALVLLGDLLLGQGHTVRATELYRSALESRPQWAAAWEGVIHGLLVQNRPHLARQYLDQAAKLFPERDSWLSFQTQVSALLDDNHEAVAVNLTANGVQALAEASSSG
jgi:tetratricopeptide (TPR) repeat protein